MIAGQVEELPGALIAEWSRGKAHLVVPGQNGPRTTLPETSALASSGRNTPPERWPGIPTSCRGSTPRSGLAHQLGNSWNALKAEASRRSGTTDRLAGMKYYRRSMSMAGPEPNPPGTGVQPAG